MNTNSGLITTELYNNDNSGKVKGGNGLSVILFHLGDVHSVLVTRNKLDKLLTAKTINLYIATHNRPNEI
ncbi:hypothetical protein PBAL39_09126 [Pedobacter sp. BAL39]|nr:hypothetical protein PBAL39_09126 [Pedobacter sp. BAL39]